MEGPRPARKEEFEEVMILLNQIFKKSMRDNYPQVYTNREETLKNMITRVTHYF
ncbi:hypothetical protein LR007_01220 [candidate division NPL-UPA2 bacterium]|nr:hypothetical protein [candidate division NPL-UPA2 bacterium]